MSVRTKSRVLSPLTEHNKLAVAWAEANGGKTMAFADALRKVVHKLGAEEEFEWIFGGHTAACEARTEEEDEAEDFSCKCFTGKRPKGAKKGGVGFVPDAWSLQITPEETHIFTICEVQDTAVLTEVKMSSIGRLWWACDDVGMGNDIILRLVVVDRCGVARRVDLMDHSIEMLDPRAPILPLKWFSEGVAP